MKAAVDISFWKTVITGHTYQWQRVGCKTCNLHNTLSLSLQRRMMAVFKSTNEVVALKVKVELWGWGMNVDIFMFSFLFSNIKSKDFYTNYLNRVYAKLFSDYNPHFSLLVFLLYTVVWLTEHWMACAWLENVISLQNNVQGSSYFVCKSVYNNFFFLFKRHMELKLSCPILLSYTTIMPKE